MPQGRRGGPVTQSLTDAVREAFSLKPPQLECSSGGRIAQSVAAPAAFGFLSDQAGSISAEGSLLYVSDGKTISVIGGDILFHNSAWFAQEGRINLASAISSGEIRSKKLFFRMT